jgi:Na+/glutamate symporter
MEGLRCEQRRDIDLGVEMYFFLSFFSALGAAASLEDVVATGKTSSISELVFLSLLTVGSFVLGCIDKIRE